MIQPASASSTTAGSQAAGGTSGSAPGCWQPFPSGECETRSCELEAADTGGAGGQASALAEPCVYAVPSPPLGEVYDRALLNIVLSDPAGTRTVIPRVDADACEPQLAAWHFDNDEFPISVVLCPAACAATRDGELSVLLVYGCKLGPFP